MQEFIQRAFYGNTVMEWLIALSIIFAGALIAKILYWLIKNFGKKLTSKSKTRLDDIIIDMIEEPIVLAVAIAAFWYGFLYLKVSPEVAIFRDRTLYVLITFNVAWLLTRLSDALIQEYIVPLVEKSESDLDDQILPLLRKGLKIIIWTLAIVVGLNNAGYNVGAMIAGLGIGGLAFAMAAKDTVANFFGGLTIYVDKPFTINDRIKVSGFDGTVKEIGIRSTRLRTWAGRTITIPNSTFIGSAIENVSSEPSRQVMAEFKLAHDMSPDQVKQAMDIIEEVTTNNESLDECYPPSFTGFSNWALNVVVVYFIKKGENNHAVQNKINLEILGLFNKANIKMANPIIPGG